MTRRILLVYSNTGKGHKSVADALTESVMSAEEGCCPSLQVEHADIYQLAEIPFFGKAGRQYELLCRHARWLYDIMFGVTDNVIAKNIITEAILRIYGSKLASVIARAAPDVIVVVHPLFVSDVLCKLRDRSCAEWRVISFVTDLGVAHAGWTAVGLDSALLVSPRQMQKLRSQGCLPPHSRTAVARAPVRGAFGGRDRSIDEKVMEMLDIPHPYVLYIPGLQSAKEVMRQVMHLNNTYPEIRIVLVGSISCRLVRRLRNIQSDLIHLRDLPAQEMAAILGNAEVVLGKAGPAIMAEAARVGVNFVPTAEVGRQEAGNVGVGRVLYGVNTVPHWGKFYREAQGLAASAAPAQGQPRVLNDSEVRMLLISSSA